MERRFAGARKGDLFVGLKHFERRMTMHWMDNGAGRFTWCDCMPAFRVGTSVFHPGMVKGRKAKKRYARKAWRPHWRQSVLRLGTNIPK